MGIWFARAAGRQVSRILGHQRDANQTLPGIAWVDDRLPARAIDADRYRYVATLVRKWLNRLDGTCVDSHGRRTLTTEFSQPAVVVLGIAQDGGYPQVGCRRACCRRAANNSGWARYPAGLAIVADDRCWLIDCTPRLPEQLALLETRCGLPIRAEPPALGILLTHAHLGHYTGLLQLGPEAMGARDVPLFALPRMAAFLRTNQPWQSLVSRSGGAALQLQEIAAEQWLPLSDSVRVRPLPVPHRDEFSETVGYWIEGPNRAVFYLPDIDRWDDWDRSLENLLPQLDIAFLDGTFTTTVN